MRTPVTSAVCLALLMSVATPAVAGTSTAHAAAGQPRAGHAGTGPTVKHLVLRTDAMPTRVSVTVSESRLTCVRVTTGPGRVRRVWISLTNAQRSSAYVRVKPRSRTGCLLAGAAAPRGTRVDVVVEEDVLGPFDPRAEGSLTL